MAAAGDVLERSGGDLIPVAAAALFEPLSLHKGGDLAAVAEQAHQEPLDGAQASREPTRANRPETWEAPFAAVRDCFAQAGGAAWATLGKTFKKLACGKRVWQRGAAQAMRQEAKPMPPVKPGCSLNGASSTRPSASLLCPSTGINTYASSPPT